MTCPRLHSKEVAGQGCKFMPGRFPCWEVSIPPAWSFISVTVRIPESCQSHQTFIKRQPETLSLQVSTPLPEGRPRKRILENSLGRDLGVLLGRANGGWGERKG